MACSLMFELRPDAIKIDHHLLFLGPSSVDILRREPEMMTGWMRGNPYIFAIGRPLKASFTLFQ